MTPRRSAAPKKEDPVLEARIQHALKAYKGRLTPEALIEARRMLTLVLTTHPVASRLMDRLQERVVPGSSGVQPSQDSDVAETEPERQSQSKAKRGRGSR